MSRRLLTTAAALIVVMAAPGLALAQKGGSESRPAVMPFGAVGADGATALGAGLRLFPSPGAAAIAPTGPGPAAVPAPSVATPRPPAVVKPAGATGPTLPGGKPAPLPPTGGATAAPASPTAFTVDPAISARVRDQALAAALPTSPNPDGLRAAIASGGPWREFDQLLRQHDYDPHDLADVVAAFYLIAWEVATGGDALAQPAGIAAVRGQAREMLASNPAMARMNEAERQATAETLAFHAMAIAARHQDLQNAGGGPQVMAYRTEVANAVAQWQGIDLRRFSLTATGFQER